MDSIMDDYSDDEDPLWEEGSFLVSYQGPPSSNDESCSQLTFQATLKPGENVASTNAIREFKPTDSYKLLIVRDVPSSDSNYFLECLDTFTILSEQLGLTCEQYLSLRGWIPFRKTTKNTLFKLQFVIISDKISTILEQTGSASKAVMIWREEDMLQTTLDLALATKAKVPLLHNSSGKNLTLKSVSEQFHQRKMDLHTVYNIGPCNKRTTLHKVMDGILTVIPLGLC
jgi:hypothetical protein